MPRPKPLPKYRKHTPSGQAVVTIRQADGSRRDTYLGKFQSAESVREYDRIVAELKAASARPPNPHSPAVRLPSSRAIGVRPQNGGLRKHHPDE